MSQSIFTEIKKQLVRNEIYGNEQKFVIKADEYPVGVIKWLTNNKVFKVTDVNIQRGYKFNTFTISYKDCYTGSDFLETAYEVAKAKREKMIRKGFTTDESVTTKFLKLADTYRSELDCPNFSSQPDEDGYKQCPFNNLEYEMLDKADDCTFEMYLQEIGYKNYEEFIRENEFQTKEFKEVFEEKYQEFLNNMHTKEYENGYVY